MYELLRDMPLFMEVAKHNSFTLAAEALGMYISTLSRKIAQLEKDLGVTLFLRSTRQVTLTDSGKMLYERCRYLLAETESIYDEVVQNTVRPAGPVRIAVSADLYHTYMWGIAARFSALWPDIQLHVHFTQQWVDLLSQPFDLDIRAGTLPDSDLRARKLASMTPRLYASPKFLEKYPEPKTPKDLSAIPCVMYEGLSTVWAMRKGKKLEKVTVKAVHQVNSVSVALEFVQAGLGVTWLVEAALNHPEVKASNLVPVLQGWTVPDMEINVVMAKSQLPYRVRLFVDFLVEHFTRQNTEPAAHGPQQPLHG